VFYQNEDYAKLPQILVAVSKNLLVMLDIVINTKSTTSPLSTSVVPCGTDFNRSPTTYKYFSSTLFSASTFNFLHLYIQPVPLEVGD